MRITKLDFTIGNTVEEDSSYTDYATARKKFKQLKGKYYQFKFGNEIVYPLKIVKLDAHYYVKCATSFGCTKPISFELLEYYYEKVPSIRAVLLWNK
jgi:hypothetical protein